MSQENNGRIETGVDVSGSFTGAGQEQSGQISEPQTKVTGTDAVIDASLEAERRGISHVAWTLG